MPWVRFDDTFPIHRKVEGLSDAAFRLHVSAVFWCARNLTDGCVPEEDLELVTARVRNPTRFTTELVTRGVWHEPGHVCDSENCPAYYDTAAGWVIHDYLEFQPSKGKVDADRRANAARQKAWRERQKGEGNGGDDAADEPDHDGDRNGVSNPGRNSAPSRPGPSRPESPKSPTSAGGAGGDADADASGQTDTTKPTKSKTKSDRGTRLPDGFEPDEAMKAWARKAAPSCGREDHEAFCDYWRGVAGAKGRKVDWVATWRNWMRREHKKRTSSGGHARAPDRRSTTDDRAAQALEAGRQLQSEREAAQQETQQQNQQALSAFGGG